MGIDERLEDTRDIAMQARTAAQAALDTAARLESAIEKLRAENDEQHKEARSIIRDGLGKVHSRLNAIIYGGWGVALAIIAYLMVEGAPWVTHAQLREVLEHLK